MYDHETLILKDLWEPRVTAFTALQAPGQSRTSVDLIALDQASDWAPARCASRPIQGRSLALWILQQDSL